MGSGVGSVHDRTLLYNVFRVLWNAVDLIFGTHDACNPREDVTSESHGM